MHMHCYLLECTKHAKMACFVHFGLEFESMAVIKRHYIRADLNLTIACEVMGSFPSTGNICLDRAFIAINYCVISYYVMAANCFYSRSTTISKQ